MRVYEWQLAQWRWLVLFIVFNSLIVEYEFSIIILFLQLLDHEEATGELFPVVEDQSKQEDTDAR